MRTRVLVAGGGPAGACAAMAARREGASVEILERSRAARHKVCGEFLPGEAAAVLEDLGVWPEVLRSNPARIRRCVLRLGSRIKEWRLDAAGYSLSRLELDEALLRRAVAAGATLRRGESYAPDRATGDGRVVLACGRGARTSGAPRLFGFKAHFAGPSDDAVELYFTDFGYVGISPIENGLTNVCGIAREDVLARYGFGPGRLLDGAPGLAERMKTLELRMPWLRVGPLAFSTAGGAAAPEGAYPAGDALCFLDPFTGSGMLNAMVTGRLAGAAAARRAPVEEYLRECRRILRRPTTTSRVLRAILEARLGWLASMVPGGWLYRLTRPATPDLLQHL